jgi:hypothetical protein
MNIALLVLWAADGWCGTPWPGHPHPHPDPDPWWWRLIGLVGGIIGGWLFSVAWPAGNVEPAVFAAVSSLGAFIGGAVLHSFLGMARSASPAART